MPNQKTAVVLFNLGGPDSPDAVRPLALPTLTQGIYTVRLQTTAGTISKRLTIE